MRSQRNILIKQCQRSIGQLIMCHTLPRIGYKAPYNKRVESRDSEEGDAKVKEAGKPHWS